MTQNTRFTQVAAIALGRPREAAQPPHGPKGRSGWAAGDCCSDHNLAAPAWHGSGLGRSLSIVARVVASKGIRYVENVSLVVNESQVRNR
jgi:hypothetical protein